MTYIQKMYVNQKTGEEYHRLERIEVTTFSQDDRSFDELINEGELDLGDIASYAFPHERKTRTPWQQGLWRKLGCYKNKWD